MEGLLKEEYIKNRIDYKKKRVVNLLQEYTTMSYTDIIDYCKLQFSIIDNLRQDLDRIR